MVISEHVWGTIYIPIRNTDGSFTVMEHAFTEDDIIQNACSITSRCCDDQTFDVGGVRPDELSIKLRIALDGVNAYTLYGAKIRLYSIYDSAENAEPVLRGEFWVTSVSRTKTIYTLRASDALVWLDSGSYLSSSGQSQTENDNPVYQYCSGAIRTLPVNFSDGVMEFVNRRLTEWGIDTIAFDIRQDVTNAFPNGLGYVLPPIDVVGSCGSRSPRDYAAYLAQIAAGCVQMIPDPDNPDVCKLYLTPYNYHPTAECSDRFKAMWDHVIAIPYGTITADSCDIADYEVSIQSVYAKTYDEIGWSSESEYDRFGGNAVLDLSDNPFLNGRWLYNGQPFDVFQGIRQQLTLEKRPFSVKCHPQFAKLTDYPKLGQKIKIEEAPDDWKTSIITKMVWNFRGGWEFGCAGKDSRVLSQAAKRSLAKHAEEHAKTYANIVANNASGGISEAKQLANEAWAYADAAQANANSRVSYDEYNTEIAAIWAAINAKE
ncbi:MAG: hypothetical protein ACI4JQ_04605 [Ruminococcus sp.]